MGWIEKIDNTTSSRINATLANTIKFGISQRACCASYVDSNFPRISPLINTNFRCKYFQLQANEIDRFDPAQCAIVCVCSVNRISRLLYFSGIPS